MVWPSRPFSVLPVISFPEIIWPNYVHSVDPCLQQKTCASLDRVPTARVVPSAEKSPSTITEDPAYSRTTPCSWLMFVPVHVCGASQLLYGQKTKRSPTIRMIVLHPTPEVCIYQFLLRMETLCRQMPLSSSRITRRSLLVKGNPRLIRSHMVDPALYP